MKVIQCFDLIIKSDEENPQLRENMADFLYEVGMYDEAVK